MSVVVAVRTVLVNGQPELREPRSWWRHFRTQLWLNNDRNYTQRRDSDDKYKNLPPYYLSVYLHWHIFLTFPLTHPFRLMLSLYFRGASFPMVICYGLSVAVPVPEIRELSVITGQTFPPNHPFWLMANWCIFIEALSTYFTRYDLNVPVPVLAYTASPDAILVLT